MVAPASSHSSWPDPSKVFRRKVPRRYRTEAAATTDPAIVIVTVLAMAIVGVIAVVIADAVAVVIVLGEGVATSGPVIETAANAPRHQRGNRPVPLLLRVASLVAGRRCRSKTLSRT